MKQLYLVLLFIIANAGRTQAQFVVNNGGMLITSGTIFTVDSLSLFTSADLTIAYNSLTHIYVNEQVLGGTTINSVYRFDNPVSFSGGVEIKYNIVQLAGNTEASLKVVHTAANAPVIWLTTSGSMVNMATKVVSGSYGNVPIARLSATAISVPLPIILVSFDAVKGKDNRTAQLIWKVDKEVNFDRFEVERGVDGNSFSLVGSVLAMAIHNYELFDSSPQKGWNFYRLKSVDKDGSFTYSMVRKLLFENPSEERTISPNPVSSQLTIHSTGEDKIGTTGKVLDAAGKLILLFTLQPNATSIDASGWAAGVYFIILGSGEHFKVQKI